MKKIVLAIAVAALMAAGANADVLNRVDQDYIRSLKSNQALDVFAGYRFYALVKFCHEVREGYLLVYINDVEMQRAEAAIKAVVKKSTSEDPSIDTNKLWDLALKQANNRPISRSYCEMQYYRGLLDLSPIDPYSIRNPAP